VAEEPACVQFRSPSQSSALAKELIDTGTGTVYLAGGSAAISDAAWASYSPPAGLRKNSTRHLLFASSCYLRSVSMPADCRDQACLALRQIDGATWVELARGAQARCLPDPQGCTPGHGKPGNLRATALVKCRNLEFRGHI
jgi:hypothetical protein